MRQITQYDIMCFMDYEFSFGWLAGGLVIALAGGLIVIFYKQIADNLVNGVSSYDKVKLFGIVVIVVGFLFASNLFFFVLDVIAHLLFGDK